MGFGSSRDRPAELRAVVFDWAGTTVDFGCVAPVEAFMGAFARAGVEVDQAEASGPMGMAKLDHIRTVAALPAVSARWRATHGRDFTEADAQAIYADVVPTLAEAAAGRAVPIEGVAGLVDRLRGQGLAIGSTTGYPRQVMDAVLPIASAGGYAPDCVVCEGETTRGRPWPFLVHRAMEALDVADRASVIVVDDTPVGIEAGLNAGAWTVGVVDSGSLVGLDRAAFQSLPERERERRRLAAADRLLGAGAHYLVDTVAALDRPVAVISRRLARGDRP